MISNRTQVMISNYTQVMIGNCTQVMIIDYALVTTRNPKPKLKFNLNLGWLKKAKATGMVKKGYTVTTSPYLKEKMQRPHWAKVGGKLVY